MPFLPMQRLDIVPPQWRSLFYPGGCEFYEIKIPAENFVLQVGIGNPYSLAYRRRDNRYRRWPTRNFPALPAQFPFALLRYRDDALIIDDAVSPLVCPGGAAAQYGPASVGWEAEHIWFSWNERFASPVRAGISSPLTTTFSRIGAICESAALENFTGPFSSSAGTISHVHAHRLTVELAAQFLRIKM